MCLPYRRLLLGGRKGGVCCGNMPPLRGPLNPSLRRSEFMFRIPNCRHEAACGSSRGVGAEMWEPVLSHMDETPKKTVDFVTGGPQLSAWHSQGTSSLQKAALSQQPGTHKTTSRSSESATSGWCGTATPRLSVSAPSYIGVALTNDVHGLA